MAHENLKSRLAAMLAERGMKWKDLAQAAGLNPNIFPGWWRGKTPDTSSLQHVAKALNVSIAALVGEPEPKQNPAPMNLESEPFLEIKGKVWATPDRVSIQRAAGQFIKGKPGEQDCFALIVEGDSMMPWYIPGELVICRPKAVELKPYNDSGDETVYVPYEIMARYNNRDAVVEHEGDVMLKRLQIERTKGPMYNLWMTSTNPKYPKVKVRFGDEWRMQALVIRSEKPQITE